MIPCPTCEFINEEGTAFCIQCGHDFTSTPNPMSPEQTEAKDEAGARSETIPQTDSEGAAADGPDAGLSEEVNEDADDANQSNRTSTDSDQNRPSDPMDLAESRTGKNTNAVAPDVSEPINAGSAPNDSEGSQVDVRANLDVVLSTEDEKGDQIAYDAGPAPEPAEGREVRSDSDKSSLVKPEIDAIEPSANGPADQESTAQKTEDTVNVDAGQPAQEANMSRSGAQKHQKDDGAADSMAEGEFVSAIERETIADNENMNRDPLASLPPPPASSAVSPLQFADSGEAAFGERWWLKPSAAVPAAGDKIAQTAPIDVVEDFQTEGDDQTDPKINRPAHIPTRAAAEIDRRRFEELPTVSETERKPLALIIGLVLGIAVLLFAALK
ncbi:MAG: hypothetical protein VYA30_10705 [Myxococcota bacterium]|nr:hypothetical protein [Myxococcota bacterium]